MRRYFCIVFIDFILKSKHLLDHANLFSCKEYEKKKKKKKNDKVILKYFQ